MDVNNELTNCYLDSLDQMERERDERIQTEIDELFTRYESALNQPVTIISMDDYVDVLEPVMELF